MGTDATTTDLPPTTGVVEETAKDMWRWTCGGCPARSADTYPTFGQAYAGLELHHCAARGWSH